MDRVEQRAWHGHVRIDENEHVSHGMIRPGVAGSRNVPHRLMNHYRALVPRDGGGLILAVVVDDDDVDVGVRASAQMVRGGSDRIQRRREVGLFVEGGNDDRKSRSGMSRFGCCVEIWRAGSAWIWDTTMLIAFGVGYG